LKFKKTKKVPLEMVKCADEEIKNEQEDIAFNDINPLMDENFFEDEDKIEEIIKNQAKLMYDCKETILEEMINEKSEEEESK
jgi:hypothetical protein